MTNPRILDIQTQVIDVWQSGTCPSYWRAVQVVAERLDLSPTIVDDCANYVQSEMDNPDYYLIAFAETLLPDPFDTGADDWDESYWR